MKRNFGYTLMEVLILIGLIGIFTASLLSFFMGMLRTERQARFSLKTEGDVSALRTFLKKELQSIGFGISFDYLKTQSLCSNNAVISGNTSEVCYLSLASRQSKWTGCWWVVDSTLNATTKATSRLGSPCPALPWNAGGYCVFLDYNRGKKGVYRCNDISQASSSIIFYLYNSPITYPSDFLVKLSVEDTSVIDKSCHPDLRRKALMLRIGNDPPQPIISCVYDFHLCYIDKTGSPSSTLPSIQNLAGIRVCMIVQAGGRGSIGYQQSLNYSERCRCGNYTNPITFPVDYQFYPFKVIEEEVSLPNLKGWGS